MGILASFLAAVLSTAKDLVSKHLSFHVHSLVSTFASFAFALPYYVLFLAISYVLGFEDFLVGPQFFLLVFLRSVTDALAEGFKMAAIERGDISLVSPLVGLAPLFLLFVSPLITGDSISGQGALGVVLIVAGTLVLTYHGRKGQGTLSYSAIAFGLTASFFFALNNSFDRLAAQQASPLVAGGAMTLLACIIISPFLLRMSELGKQLANNSKSFLLRGLFEAVFMTTKLFALQFLAAHYVAALMKSSLVFSIIGGRFVFKEEEMIKRLVSSVLIVAGCVLIILTTK